MQLCRNMQKRYEQNKKKTKKRAIRKTKPTKQKY